MIFGSFNTANDTEVTDADGWSTFPIDFASYLGTNGLDPAGDIQVLRRDPLGNSADAGKWLKVDYLRVIGTPEPGSLALWLGGTGLWFTGRRRLA